MSFDDLPDQPPIYPREAEDYAREALDRSRQAAARVRNHMDIRYGDDYWQKMDIYLPDDTTHTDLPVLLFAHGGAWTHGYKEWLGLMAPVIVETPAIFVSVSYRLAPEYKFPAQAEDVARAVRWTYEHIGEYGGDPHRIFLCGHSAGAHLAALVALDEKYLAAEGVPAEAVAGVVGLSGPYDVALLREDAGWCWFAGWYFVEPTFGEKAENWEAASAPRFASPAAPPFLLLYADGDIPHLAAQAYRLSSALAREGVRAPVHKIAGRNHYTIIFNVGKDDDPTTAAVLDFIDKRRAATPGEGDSVPESP